MTLDASFSLKRSYSNSSEDSGYESPYKCRKTTTGRQRIPSERNLGPAVGKVNDLASAISNHSYERVQSLGLEYHNYYGKAVRTDGSLRPIEVYIGPAEVQIGMGDFNNHAAHFNPISGVRDNLVPLMIQSAKEENKVTPQAEKLLSRVYGESWPDYKNRLLTDPEFTPPIPSSIKQNSISEMTTNATNVLPRAINLQVDLPLERAIRTPVAGMLVQVSQKRIAPKEAMVKSHEMMEDFFTERVEALTPENPLLAHYTQLELDGLQRADLDDLMQYSFSDFYHKDASGKRTDQVNLDRTYSPLRNYTR